MPGKNWNSATGKWTEVVKPETNEKAREAQEMRKEGNSVSTIAKKLGVSESRVREYLK